MRTPCFRGVGLAVVVLALAAGTSLAQWSYPRGYGAYGWGGWGSDPASGLMTGLGAYARGKGAYELDKAKADAINAKTAIAWNKALQARKRALRLEKQKEQAEKATEAAARDERYLLETGATLNDLLEQVLDANAGKAEAYLSKVPLSARDLRDIPFEPATEAITLCISQLAGEDGMPRLFRDRRFDRQREALTAAVAAALREDTAGDVTPKARKALTSAIDAMRTRLDELDPGKEGDEYLDADAYLRTLAGLSRMLQDPSLKQALALLETYEKGSVGDLVAFMAAFNLRFAPATTDRQREIYRGLAPLLKQVRDQTAADSPELAPDRDGRPLQVSARKVFEGMSWKQLEAQAKQED